MNGKAGCMVFCLILTAQVFAQDIKLPTPQKTGGMPLMEALAARQSQRTFSPKQIGRAHV